MKVFSNISILLFCILTISFSACDIIEAPYTEGELLDTTICAPQTFPVNDNPIRKILLEDYTGHTCGNCPDAAETAKNIKNTYGDQIVILALHVGFFAEPYNDPSGKYTSDYRTEVGTDLDEYFGCSAAGLPRGMVNRKESSGSPVLSHSAWNGVVQSIVNEPPVVDIQVLTNFDEETRTACADVQVEMLTDISDEIKVCVYLTEDSIVDWQKDYSAVPSDLENYVHEHALRASFNGTWGVPVGTAPLSDGDKEVFRYSLQLDEEWRENHCSVVAYVYNASSDEILQAEEAHLD